MLQGITFTRWQALPGMKWMDITENINEWTSTLTSCLLRGTEKQGAGLFLSLQKHDEMLVQLNKRDAGPDAVNIAKACLMISHYVQFLMLA